MTNAEVKLWGKTIGAVSWDDTTQSANFEYTQKFAESRIEIAPLMMPLSQEIYNFAALPKPTFRGLPGLLADSLPDDFGNALINAWLAREGRDRSSFNPVERLCYTGSRGMGALEYIPAQGPIDSTSKPIEIDALVNLASNILAERNRHGWSFDDSKLEESLTDILQVSTSAGGARAKAIIAWNAKTNEVRSGQVKAEKGFSYWLLKFDGVSIYKDKKLDDPAGYGLIEYAYYKMALAAGIEMTECRLLKENGRNHFMTKRFDRTDQGQKIHMQSLGAMEHFDFKQTGAHSYEQALRTIRKLEMPMERIEEQFRRMAFNIIGRNQDDHVKNISFMMGQSGRWNLSPAYDVTYSYNPTGDWTASHQMSLNGKCDDFTIEDFWASAKNASMKRGRADEIINQVQQAVSEWESYAIEAGVSGDTARGIKKHHRGNILK